MCACDGAAALESVLQKQLELEMTCEEDEEEDTQIAGSRGHTKPPKPEDMFKDGLEQRETGTAAYKEGQWEAAIDSWCMARGTMSPEDAETTGVSLTLDTGSNEFDKLLKGSCFPVNIVGVASFPRMNKHVASLATSLARRADMPHLLGGLGGIIENSKEVIMVEKTVDLVAPEVVLTAVEPPAKFGQQSIVKLSLQNPFPKRSLTGLTVLVEGPRLFRVRNPAGQKSIKLPDVAPGASIEFEVEVTPRGVRMERIPLMLVTTIVCAEIEGIYGKHEITVNSRNREHIRLGPLAI